MNDDDPAPWRGRWLLYAAGLAMVAIGLRGIVHNTNGWEHPPFWLLLLIGGAVGHDLILAPLVFVAAVVLMRLAPAGARPLVASGLAISGVLTLIAWPGIRGDGRTSDNPTILPINYTSGLLTALGVLWTGLALYGLYCALRQSRRA